MTKLKILAAIGAATLMTTGAMATAASAQPWRDHNYAGRSYEGRLTSGYIDSLEWKINNAAQERRISWGEARQLRAELRQIQGPMIYRVETGRASNWEIRRVSMTVNRIETATQRYANNGRYPRYGYNNRY